MIAETQTALINYLTSMSKADKLQVHVGEYEGQLDDKLLGEIQRHNQSIFVVFTGLTPTKDKLRGQKVYEVNYTLVTSGKSVHRGKRRNMVTLLIDWLEDAIEGFSPDNMFRSFTTSKVSNLFNAKVERTHLAVYSYAIKGKVLATRGFDPGQLDDFLTLHHEATPAGVGTVADTPNLETDILQQTPET